MAVPRCSCAFRLYHFNASLTDGGAASSCRGESLGRKKRAELDKADVMAGYLGSAVDRAQLPAEMQSDELSVTGFEEDARLQVGSPHAPPLALLSSFLGGDCAHAWPMGRGS